LTVRIQCAISGKSRRIRLDCRSKRKTPAGPVSSAPLLSVLLGVVPPVVVHSRFPDAQPLLSVVSGLQEG
jgi:hypothetical protein